MNDTTTPNETRAGASVDKLDFAQRVGNALLLEEGADGIVVTVESPWGHGKSTVLSSVETYLRDLDESAAPLIAKFNPWEKEDAGEFAFSYFTDLADALRHAPELEGAMALAEVFKRYARLSVQGVGEMGDVRVSSAAGGVNETGSVVEREELHQIICDKVATLSRPIVVFIDDLDRLPPDRAYEMLKLLRNAVQFPRTAIVVAFDTAYLEEALTSRGIVDPAQYLDRIVQVRMRLPELAADDMTALIEDELAKLPSEVVEGGFPDAKQRLTELYQGTLRYLIRTPREVKQVFDRLRFSERATRGEVVFADLFAIETLAVKAPEIYSHIRNNPELYCGYRLDEQVSEEDAEQMVLSFSDARMKLAEDLAQQDRKHIQRLLVSLFPFTGIEGVRASQSFFVERGRVAAVSRLHTALTYGIPLQEKATPLVKEFLAVPENRMKILRELLASGELRAFLSQLSAVIDEEEVALPEDMVSVLSVVAGSQRVQRTDADTAGRFQVGIARQIWWVIERYLCSLSREQRLRYLGLLAANSGSLTLATEALSLCMRQHGLLGNADVLREDARWCTKKELGRLQEIWLKSVRSVFGGSAFCTLSGKRDVLELLRKIDAEEARRQVDSLMQLEEDLDCLAPAFGRRGHDPENGAYVEVDPDFLDAIGGFEHIRSRVRQRLYSGPPIDAELAAVYASIESGARAYIQERMEEKVAS